MKRLSRRDIALLGLAVRLLAAPPVRAEGERVFRIESLVPATVAEGIDAFVDQMRQLGYEEGRNLVFDRHVVETPERNAALAAELVALNPDVLLGSGALQVEALKRATPSIPIVFAWVSGPVGLRLVESLARDSRLSPRLIHCNFAKRASGLRFRRTQAAPERLWQRGVDHRSE